jgi:type IV secretion system protein VirD4
MGALFNSVYQADGLNIPNRVLFEIDEAAVLGKMKEINLAYATARKYRAVVQTIWQSRAQMDQTLGVDDARTMRDASSWISYGSIQDGDVAKKVSEDFGQRGVMAWSEGENSGRQFAQKSRLFGSRSTGMNTSAHEISRPLIRPDEITRAEPDEIFVLVRGYPHPIRAFAAPYFKYPKINALMAKSRFVS